MIDRETVERLRVELAVQRSNLRREIADQGADADSDDIEIDVERNFADSGRSTEERAQLLTVVKALRANLRWVDRALGKIDRGTYGVCERCGKPISPDRLDALPWAILCIECMRAGDR